MDFDFLPEAQQDQSPQPTPGGAEPIPPTAQPGGQEPGGKPGKPGSGTSIKVGANYFFDDYKNHFEIQTIFDIPPIESQFRVKQNYLLVKEKFSEEVIKNRIRNDWYGLNTDYDKLINGYTLFADPEMLESTIEKLDGALPKDLISGIEKPKMLINDRFGMFSFDLASMAMTYVYEYLDKKNNIIPPDFVEKIKGIFINTKTNEEVYQRIKKRENGTPVVVSSVRKSLIAFEKKETDKRAVHIFITTDMDGRTPAQSYLYNSMAAISIVKNLIIKGFLVKISAVFVGIINKNIHYDILPVKHYTDTLDINAIAYVCGDARFYRYQYFKAIVAGCDRIGEVCPSGFGGVISDVSYIAEKIEKEYIPNSKLKQPDTRLYFGGSRNLEQAKQEVKTAVKILDKKFGHEN